MPAQPSFSQPELDQMLAPIALYPDPLLTQILMASTYPLEVVEAARWSITNPNLRGVVAVRAIQQMNWDPSVKSLVAFPKILQMMNDRLDWTERLGDAFLAQQPQVMDTVQNLRQRAYVTGTLMSNDQIQVVTEGQNILVEPANAGIIYVPYYDPTVVYGSWWWADYPPVQWAPWTGYYTRPGYAPRFAWDIGIPIIAEFFFGDFDWHHRRVNIVNVNSYYYNQNGRDERDAAHKGNSAPGVWQHDPSHRRGVPYREESLNRQYGRISTSHDARRDFRGYDQPASNLVGAGNLRNESSSALPNHTNSPGSSATSQDTHSNQTHSFSGSGSPGRTNERSAQVRPNGQAEASRPAVEIRPHAFEGIERGAEVQIHSSRGRASIEGANQSPGNNPAQRPSGKASGDGKQRSR